MIWLVFGLLIVTRLIPYFFSPVPTGYDAGIYLYQFQLFPFVPDWLKTEFFPGLFWLTWPLTKLGLQPESLLIPLQIAAEVFLFGCLYWVVKKLTDKKTALLAAFLLAVSAIQFRAYWYFYVKNIFALGLMLLALTAINRKQLVLSVVFIGLVAWFHLPTLLMLAMILAVCLLILPGQRLFLIKVGALSAALTGLIYAANYRLAIAPLLDYIVKSINLTQMITGQQSGGSFYSLGIAWLLTLLYLPLTIYGLMIAKKIKVPTVFLVGLIVNFIWVILRFSFYQRFFITLDIFLIFWAGIGLKALMEKYRKHLDLWQFYLAAAVIFIIAFIFKTGQPLINRQLFNEIKAFKAEPTATLLSTDKVDTAWLLGYTDYPVIAWKYGGEDKYWTNDQWQQLFDGDGQTKISLLQLLPQPLYIFINDQNLAHLADLQTVPCFKPASLHFYQFSCQ